MALVSNQARSAQQMLRAIIVDNSTDYVLSFGGLAATAGASTVEQSFTSFPVNAGEYGVVIPLFNPANGVVPLTWRCAVTGTCIVNILNPTAGSLTMQQADSTHPYALVTWTR